MVGTLPSTQLSLYHHDTVARDMDRELAVRVAKCWLLVSLVVTPVLGACAALGSKPGGEKPDDEKPATHVDLAYTQFILHSESQSLKPYNLASLRDVPQECGVPEVSVPKSGGVEVLKLADSLLGKMASAIENVLQKWVDAEIAKYSSDVVGKPAHVAFYSPQLWFRKPGSSDKYSCFIIAMNKCDKTKIDKDRGSCPNASAEDARVLIVGQYRLTPEFLQIRPLWGQVRGFEAKRSGSDEATISATLKFESVWWDGHQGLSVAAAPATVLTAKFKPTDDGPNDPGVDLVVKHKDAAAPGGYAFADWDLQPLLPRPPQTEGTDGTVSVIASVAEATSPPEGLKLVQKLLKEHGSDISSALSNALQGLDKDKAK
jgi:hypothetical protein